MARTAPSEEPGAGYVDHLHHLALPGLNIQGLRSLAAPIFLNRVLRPSQRREAVGVGRLSDQPIRDRLRLLRRQRRLLLELLTAGPVTAPATTRSRSTHDAALGTDDHEPARRQHTLTIRRDESRHHWSNGWTQFVRAARRPTPFRRRSNDP